jgi:hypothetical protein
MTANIKVTSDESALSRLYLWLLSLNDETLATEKQNAEDKPEPGPIALALTQSDEGRMGRDRA